MKQPKEGERGQQVKIPAHLIFADSKQLQFIDSSIRRRRRRLKGPLIARSHSLPTFEIVSMIDSLWTQSSFNIKQKAKVDPTLDQHPPLSIDKQNPSTFSFHGIGCTPWQLNRLRGECLGIEPRTLWRVAESPSPAAH